MRMFFPTKWEYVDLIQTLAQTRLSREFDDSSFVSMFRQIRVRLYGAPAKVVYVGPLQEQVEAYIPPSGFRAVLLRLGLTCSPTIGRSVIGFRGNQFVESYSQAIGLCFVDGGEFRFEARRVSSKGLPFALNDYVTSIFASTGADLVPFAFKWGTRWIWLYGDMSSRLEAAGVCKASLADERFNAVAGMVNVTVP